MIIARQGGVKRPPKILGLIQLFDRTVQKAQQNNKFSERQPLRVDAIGKTLVFRKVKWTSRAGDQRRRLRRIECSWNPPIVHIPKEVVDRETPKSSGGEDVLLQAAVSEVVDHVSDEGLTESKAQLRDISAGGVSASNAFAVATGDFGVLGGESRSIPFALHDLCGGIRSVEEDVERGYLVFYFCLLNKGPELRKGIVGYLYKKHWPKAARRGADKNTRSGVVGPS